MPSPIEAILFRVKLTNALNTTPEINWEEMKDGAIAIPTGYTSVTLTFYAANEPIERGGVYRAAYTSGNSAITMTVAAARHYQLPQTLYGFAWLKIVTDADDSTKVVEITGK